MDTREFKIRKILAIALAAGVAALGITALSIQTTLAESDDDNKDEERPEITVEVVEDIPAEDIEEQKVPLADSSATAAAANTRMTVVSWTLGAVALAYAVFIISGMRIRKGRRMKRSGGGSDRESAGGR
jgi:hypothetical protein